MAYENLMKNKKLSSQTRVSSFIKPNEVMNSKELTALEKLQRLADIKTVQKSINPEPERTYSTERPTPLTSREASIKRGAGLTGSEQRDKGIIQPETRLNITDVFKPKTAQEQRTEAFDAYTRLNKSDTSDAEQRAKDRYTVDLYVNRGLTGTERREAAEDAARAQAKAELERSKGLTGAERLATQRELEAKKKDIEAERADMYQNPQNYFDTKPVNYAKEMVAKDFEYDSKVAAVDNQLKNLRTDSYRNLALEDDFWQKVREGEKMPTADKEEVEGTYSNFDLFTEDERNIYNYLLAKKGEAAAHDYYEHNRSNAQTRYGEKVAAAIEDKKGLGKAAALTANALGTGVASWMEGVLGSVSREELPQSGLNYASEAIKKNLGTVGKLAYDLGVTVGNMLPSIYLSAVTAPALASAGVEVSAAKDIAGKVGSGVLGLSAGGNAYQQGLREGMTRNQAYWYGTMVGVSEAALQNAMQGITQLSGAKTGAIAESIKGIENGALRFVASIGNSALNEGAEEAMQAILEPMFKTVVTGKDLEVDWSEVAYNGLMGALTGGAFESVGVAQEELDRRNTFTELANHLGGENQAMVSSLVESMKYGEGTKARKLGNDLSNALQELLDNGDSSGVRQFLNNNRKHFNDLAVYMKEEADQITPEDKDPVRNGTMGRVAAAQAETTEASGVEAKTKVLNETENKVFETLTAQGIASDKATEILDTVTRIVNGDQTLSNNEIIKSGVSKDKRIRAAINELTGSDLNTEKSEQGAGETKTQLRQIIERMAARNAEVKAKPIDIAAADAELAAAEIKRGEAVAAEMANMAKNSEAAPIPKSGAATFVEHAKAAAEAKNQPQKGSVKTEGYVYSEAEVRAAAKEEGFTDAETDAMVNNFGEMAKAEGIDYESNPEEFIRYSVARENNEGIRTNDVSAEQKLSADILRVALADKGVKDVVLVSGSPSMSGANGRYENGIVYVNADRVNNRTYSGIAWTVGHEVVHHAERSGTNLRQNGVTIANAPIVNDILDVMNQLAQSGAIRGEYAKMALDPNAMQDYIARKIDAQVAFLTKKKVSADGKVIPGMTEEVARRSFNEFDARAEIAADFLGALLGVNSSHALEGRVGSKYGSVDLFAMLDETKPGLLKQLKDFVVGLRDSVKAIATNSVAERNAKANTQRMLTKLSRTLGEALDKVAAQTETQTQSETEAKMSAAPPALTDNDRQWNAQVNSVINGSMPTHSAMFLKETPAILQDVGLYDLPLTITQKHFKAALEGSNPAHPNKISETVLKQLPKLLSEPVAIIGSNTDSEGAIMIVTDAKDEGGNPVVVVIKPEGSAEVMQHRGTTNHILTIYGANHLHVPTAKGGVSTLERAASKGEILYINKKRSQELYQADGLQLPRALGNLDFDTIIRKWNGFVNKEAPTREAKNIFTGNTVKWSADDGVYAAPMYSKLQKEIEAFKGDKIGAASAISYLRGKGVKAEEIKWSGIEQFLEGKKSVNKQELLDWLRQNELVLETVTKGESETNHYMQSSETGEVIRNMSEFIDHAFEVAERYGIDEDDIRFDTWDSWWYAYVHDPETGEDRDIVTAYETEEPGSDTKWEQYSTGKAENYREILWRMPNSNYINQAMSVHWDYETGVVVHARIDDQRLADGRNALFIEEIQSDWHNEGAQKGYATKETIAQWKEYRELIDAYKIQATDERKMRLNELEKKLEPERVKVQERIAAHRAQLDTGVLADVVDSVVRSGAFANAEIAKTSISSHRSFADWVVTLMEKNAFSGFTDEETHALARYFWEQKTLKDELSDVARNDEASLIPDAPYSKTYHEYALKNLLRMAAEEGYDVLAWTPAKMQEDRWSDEYAEGYRIEYDQDIPKFLNKYGKQWGAKVEKGNLDLGNDVSYVNEQIRLNEQHKAAWEAVMDMAIDKGELERMDFIQGQIDFIEKELARLRTNSEVWVLPITKRMRESVLYEGQPKFSADDSAYMAAVDDALESDGNEVYNSPNDTKMRGGKDAQENGQRSRDVVHGKNEPRLAAGEENAEGGRIPETRLGYNGLRENQKAAVRRAVDDEIGNSTNDETFELIGLYLDDGLEYEDAIAEIAQRVFDDYVLSPVVAERNWARTFEFKSLFETFENIIRGNTRYSVDDTLSIPTEPEVQLTPEQRRELERAEALRRVFRSAREMYGEGEEFGSRMEADTKTQAGRERLRQVFRPQTELARAEQRTQDDLRLQREREREAQRRLDMRKAFNLEKKAIKEDARAEKMAALIEQKATLDEKWQERMDNRIARIKEQAAERLRITKRRADVTRALENESAKIREGKAKAEGSRKLSAEREANKERMQEQKVLSRKTAKEARRVLNNSRRTDRPDFGNSDVDTLREITEDKVTTNKISELAQKIRTAGKRAYAVVVNQAQAIDNFSKVQSEGVKAGSLVNMIYGDAATIETIYQEALVGRDGRHMGDSMKNTMLVWDEDGNVDTAKQAVLQDYMLHVHNIDRMSFTEKALNRVEAIEAEHPWLTEIPAKDFAYAAALNDTETEATGTDERRQIIRSYASALKALKEAKDKPIFADADGKPVSAATSREKVAAYEAENPWLKEKADSIYQWWDDFMSEWAIGSTLSAEDYAAWKELYPHYVPTYREGDKTNSPAVKIGGTSAQLMDIFKGAKGSVRPVRDITDSFSMLVGKIVDTSRKNELIRNIVDTALLDDTGEFGDFAIFDWDGYYDSADGYGNAMKEDAWLNGDDVKAIERAHAEAIEEIDGGYRITAFGEDGGRISAWVSKEMYRALAAVTATDKLLGEGTNTLTKLGSKLTNPMKAMITGYNPHFALRNALRDFPSAIVNSVSGMEFPKYYGKAWKEMVSNSEEWKRFKALGGTHFGYYGMSVDWAERMGEKKNFVGKAKDAVGTANEATESVTRFAEYLATIAKLGDTYEARVQGIKNAAEVTVDFSRKGEYGKLANAWIPYWNPAVQGVSKTFRQIFDNGTTVKQKFAGAGITLTRAAVIAVLPELMQYLILKLTDRYDDWEKVSDRMRDSYFLIPVPGKNNENKFIKIPKTREWGTILGTPLMRMLESANGRSDPFDNYVEDALIANFSISGVEDAIGLGTFIDLKTNKDFAGRDIVPYAYQEVSPSLQYDSDTSALAYGVAGAYNNTLAKLAESLGMDAELSPMQLDYIMSDYFGDFYSTIFEALPVGLFTGDVSVKEASQTILSALSGSWVGDNRYSNYYVGEYYDALDSLELGVANEKLLNPEDYTESYVYKLNQAFSKAYGKQMTELNKAAAELPDGDEKDAIKDEISALAIEAVEWLRNEYANNSDDPLLRVNYSDFAPALQDALIELDGYSGDYHFKPSPSSVKSYTDPKNKTKEYKLTEEQYAKYKEFYYEVYDELMSKALNSRTYKSGDAEERAEYLEEVRDDVHPKAKDMLFDWLRKNGVKSTTKEK